jgi:hypothetical protein
MRFWPRPSATRASQAEAAEGQERSPRKGRLTHKRECKNFDWSGVPPCPNPVGSSDTSGLGSSPVPGPFLWHGHAHAKAAKASLGGLCRCEGCTVRQINLTLSLAFLAPQLIKAAVEGRLPRGINIERLRDADTDWIAVPSLRCSDSRQH